MADFILLAGISEYNDKYLKNLRLAHRDAQNLHGLFRHGLGFGENATLLPADVSLRDFNRRLNAIGERFSADDRFIFYFSGHGYQHGDDQYLLLADAEKAEVEAGRMSMQEVISLQTLKARIERWPLQQTLFILDTCRQALNAGTHHGAETPYQGTPLLGRMFARSPALGPELHNGKTTSSSRSVILNACSDGDYAWEPEEGDASVLVKAFESAFGEPLKQGQGIRIDAQTPDILRQHILRHFGHNHPQTPWLSPNNGSFELRRAGWQEDRTPAADLATPLQADAKAMDERKWRLACLKNEVAAYADYLLTAPADSPHIEEAFARIETLLTDTRLAAATASVAEPSEENTQPFIQQPADITTCDGDISNSALILRNIEEVKVPDIGDFTDVPVIEVMVKVGDAIRIDDPICTLESDKATLDLPSTVDGIVREIFVQIGSKVSQGSLLVTVEHCSNSHLTPEGQLPEPRFKAPSRQHAEIFANAAPVRRLPPGTVFRDADFAPEMVVIPPGEFWMGSPEDEEGRRDNEGPLHKISIACAFAVGKYPVTQAEWQAVMGNNPSHFGNQPRHPVEQVSWDDAQAYLQKLNEMTGQNYRLLSEAEWEYCCRAGTSAAYNTGKTISTEQANFHGSIKIIKILLGMFSRGTTQVGQFPPNAFGLHDLHGNIWEWVEDYYHNNYNGAPADGSAWISDAKNTTRVLRGGSWNDTPRNARSAIRYSILSDNRLDFVGFRVARTLP